MGHSDTDETTEITQETEGHMNSKVINVSALCRSKHEAEEGVTEAQVALRSFKSHCMQKIL
jgi:hypothetical protein